MPGYARVAVTLPVCSTFHYKIPRRLAALALPGARCIVEFGGRAVAGFIIALDKVADVDEARVKELREVLDPVPCLAPDLLELAHWLSTYYHNPLGETLLTMLPPSERAVKSVAYEAVSPETSTATPPATPAQKKIDPLQAELLAEIAQKGQLPAARLKGKRARALEALLKRGLVKRIWNVAPRAKPRPLRWALLKEGAPSPAELGGNATKLAELLKLVGEGPKSVTELRAEAISSDTLKRAVERGWLELTEETVAPASVKSLGFGGGEDLTPTPEQAHCLKLVEDALESENFEPILLRGVTGSGKSEIYLRAVCDTLDRGRSAIVLVPEISLTPQLIGRFGAKLGTKLSVLHSGLSQRERGLQWAALKNGDARVVIGTRSAVFAPVSELGLIVVDEEHDGGYKQEEGLRYNAKHAALMRARGAGAVVLMGSATPELESYALAKEGRYRLVELPKRVGGALPPEIRLVDLRPEESRMRRDVLITTELSRAIDGALERGEQALLFLNRRGLSPAVYCPTCREPLRCPSCSVAMTLHGSRARGRLLCHYCARSSAAPSSCPVCGDEGLVELGAGTQKLEVELKSRWPKAKVARLDRDVAGATGGSEVLGAFARGEADILVGTQMVTKGHHFPRLTVVGVVSADDALHMPDFRAAERTFQTLVQVAGRAGRAERPGKVFIQTRNPHHPVLEAVVEADYEKFAQLELTERESAGYPPYRRVALVRVSSENRSESQRAAQTLARWFMDMGSTLSVEVLGPAPAPLEKLRGRYRHHFLLRAPGNAPGPLRQLLAHFIENGPKQGRNIKLSIDVDPVNLL